MFLHEHHWGGSVQCWELLKVLGFSIVFNGYLTVLVKFADWKVD